jgi:FMN-dependent NADH-azoreductase
MYNWNIPSALKAYIDQIIMPGVFDSYGQQGLTGKPVTIIYVSK